MTYRRDDVASARGWLLDVISEDEIDDDAPTIANANAIMIVDAINRHYGGGWAGFVADGPR